MKYFLLILISAYLMACGKPILKEEYLQEQELQHLTHFTGTVPVLQNMTTDHETVLTYLKRKNEELHFQILSNGNTVAYLQEIKSVHDKYEIVQIYLSDLNSSQIYQIQFYNKNNKVIDERIFSSLDNSKKKFKFAVSSCARVGWFGGDHALPSVWDELSAQRPDALVFLGDFVYPDSFLQALFHIHPDLKQIQDKYIQTWQQVQLYHQAKLYPVFSILDDHDYGFQGANRHNNLERMDLIKDFFRSYYPILKNQQALAVGPGAAFSIPLLGFKLILLDNKYFRIAQAEANREGPIWGKEQLIWLRQQLNEDTRPALIGSGALISFPIHNPDAAQYESPEEFKNFSEALRGTKSKAIVMTGDVHYSAVNIVQPDKFGYLTYEIIASRIHSISPLVVPPFISGKIDSIDQLIHTSEKNFVILEGDNGQLANLKVHIHEKNEKEIKSAVLFKD